MCRTCALAQRGARARERRRGVRATLFAIGERLHETVELEKITGLDRRRREERIARYADCVARGVPIVYESRRRSEDEV
jgi:hypothetical protein